MLAGDKKMNKNNNYPFKNTLLCAKHCASLYVHYLIDGWSLILEVGGNDPGEA